MGLAGIYHRLELGVGQQAIGDDRSRKRRAIARRRRRDRCHGGRLHQFGGMGPCARDADRLERIGLVDRVRQAATLGRRPVHGLIVERHAFDFSRAPGGRGGCGPGEIAANGARRGVGRDLGQRDSHAQGQVPLDPGKQRRDVWRDAGGYGKARSILGGRLVDDGQARLDRRAVLGIDRARDRCGEHDAAALLQPGEAVPPGRQLG